MTAGNRVPRNPYTNRAAIVCEEAFFGRINDLERLYSRFLGDQSVALVGERRIGKSSLLRALDFGGVRSAFGVPDELRFVYLDLQFIPECDERGLLSYLLEELTDLLGMEALEPTRQSLFAVGRMVQERMYKLVLIMDEFEVLLHNPAIPLALYSILRAWSSRYRICFAVASREGAIDPLLETSEGGSPFLNTFGTFYVGPLERAESEDLIMIPAESVGVPFREQEVLWILDLGGYHPLFLNIACSHLFDMKSKGAPADSLQRRLEREFQTEAMPHFRYLLDRIPERELTVFRAVAERRPVVDSEALSELMKKGVVIEYEGELRPFSATFARLVVSRADNELSNQELAARFKELL
jgi:hypothetical protein